MATPNEPPARPRPPRLTRGIVLRVREDSCDIAAAGRARSVGYARPFPTPHVDRVAPGHLVAVAAATDGTSVIVWRWYDAVVLDVDAGTATLWEPAHGEVRAAARPGCDLLVPGARAYLSTGLPGADWWVAGPVTAEAERADVELDEVEQLYTRHGLWAELI